MSVAEANAPGTGEVQLVSFLLGGEEYAVDIHLVQEIIRLQEITRVPEAPDFVEGVINLRGRVIPVLDLRKRFRLPQTAERTKMRIVVVSSGGRTIGLVVDGVREVLTLPLASVEPPPPVVSGIGRDYLKGIGKRKGRLLILLDLERILTAAEGRSLDAAV